jgi:RNA polymerase sigma-70 factor (ECF subfamily)
MSQHNSHPASGGKPSSSLGELSDEVLVGYARTEDVAAFEELVGRYEEKLYRLAMRFVRNENDAKEILQDAFLLAWRKLPGFEGRAQFSSWMYRVTVNSSLMFLRSRSRHPEVMLEDVELGALNEAAEHSVQGTAADWSQQPEERLQSKELRRHIQNAVEALPDGLRTVFLMRDVEGLTTEETAELFNLSLPAVKTRLHRARLVLREAIGHYFSTQVTGP